MQFLSCHSLIREAVKGMHVQCLALWKGEKKGRNRGVTPDLSGSTEHKPSGFLATE